MQLPGRNGNSSDYRYAFGGMEIDPEVSGEGNSYDFGARIYNPRTARWNSVDDKGGLYYSSTPYCFAGNNPIAFVDNDGNIIEPHGSKRYTKTMINELQKLTDLQLRYDTKTKTIGYIMPKDVAVPRTVGNSLVMALINSPNSVHVMNTKSFTEYAAKHGGIPGNIGTNPFSAYQLAENGDVMEKVNSTNTAQKIGDNAIVHLSDFMDLLPEVTMMNMTRETIPSQIIYGHELFHAHHIMYGLIDDMDLKPNTGKIDYDQVNFPGTSTLPLMSSQSNHEWEIRRLENLLRAEQLLKDRHLGYYDWNIVEELLERKDDVIGIDNEVIIKGTGLDMDDLEFWVQYLEETGVDPDVMHDINESNSVNKPIFDAYKIKAEKQAKKAEDKADRHRWYRRNSMRKEKPSF